MDRVNGLVRHVQLIFKNTLLGVRISLTSSCRSSFCLRLMLWVGNLLRKFCTSCGLRVGQLNFFWIGGQQVNITSTITLDVDSDAWPGFSKGKLELWGIKAVVVPESL